VEKIETELNKCFSYLRDNKIEVLGTGNKHFYQLYELAIEFYKKKMEVQKVK